jgi:hypothetical protein
MGGIEAGENGLAEGVGEEEEVAIKVYVSVDHTSKKFDCLLECRRLF